LTVFFCDRRYDYSGYGASTGKVRKNSFFKYELCSTMDILFFFLNTQELHIFILEREKHDLHP
jgi:hypothetical protein